MKNTILVTGGAGYIGSHVVLALRSAGEKVVVLDDFSTSSDEFRLKLVRYFRGNAGDIELVLSLLQKYQVDTIFHFAGAIRVEESVKNPLKYYLDNVATSCVLIKAAVAAGVKYFVFSSSAAVYGNPAQNPVGEECPTEPVSPYGASKLMVERMLRDVAAAHDFRYVALRYFNVAGVDKMGSAGYKIDLQPTHLIRSAVLAALGKKQYLEIFGTDYPTPDGTCIRDYIHVTDLANAHWKALEYLRQGGESNILNCGYGSGSSVLEVIEAVKENAAAMDLPYANFEVRRGPRRAGDPALLIARADAIREKLKWVPKYHLLTFIVEDELNWARAQLKI